jgi:hypothetical protein
VFVNEPPKYDVLVTPAIARRTDLLNIMLNMTSRFAADWPSVVVCHYSGYSGRCFSPSVSLVGNTWSEGDVYHGLYAVTFDLYFIPENDFPASGGLTIQFYSCGRTGCSSSQTFDNLVQLVGGSVKFYSNPKQTVSDESSTAPRR